MEKGTRRGKRWKTGLLLLAMVGLGTGALLLRPAMAAPDENTIVRFEEESPVCQIDAPVGTEQKELGLPETLKAENAAGEPVEVPVTWKGTYQADKEGSYTLTAQFKGYTYAETHPYALVRVSKAAVKVTGGENAATFSAKQPLRGDNAFVKKLTVDKVLDGTADFDSEEGDGKDQNDHNGIVRSNDTIRYDFSYQTECYDPEASYDQGNLWIEAAVPKSAEAQFQNESWASDSCDFDGRITYDFDGDGTAETEDCNIYRYCLTLLKTDTNPIAIPGTGTFYVRMKVGVPKKDTVVRPLFTAWLEGNQVNIEYTDDMTPVTGNAPTCTEHGKKEPITVQAPGTRVTEKLALNVDVNSNKYGFAIKNLYTYDFNEGDAHMPNKGKGKITGILWQIPIKVTGKSRKGIDKASGPITFDIELDDIIFRANDRRLPEEKQSYIKQNYPFLLYWQGAFVGQTRRGSILDYGRDLSNYDINKDYLGWLKNKKKPGEVWSAEQTGDKISITIANHENSQYDDADIVSKGTLMFVFPIYNNGTTDPDKKGLNIYEDLGIKQGECYINVKDVNLRANGASGDSLPIVPDNSNQTNINDDKNSKGFSIPKAEGRVTNKNIEFLNAQKKDSGYYIKLVKSEYIGMSGTLSFQTGSIGSETPVAVDLLQKIDSGFITEWKANKNNIPDGYEARAFYATKADGSAWKDDEEQRTTKMEQLQYYRNQRDIPEGHKVVGILTQIRAKSSEMEKIESYITQTLNFGSSTFFSTTDDPNLAGNVYMITPHYKLWRKSNVGKDTIPFLQDIDSGSSLSALKEASDNFCPGSYRKAQYDEDGKPGMTGGFRGQDGNDIYLLAPKIYVEPKMNFVNQKDAYSMDRGERVADLKLETKIYNYGLEYEENLRVEMTLPEGLSYITGSGYIGGEYQKTGIGKQGTIIDGTQKDPIVETTPDGKKKLVWMLLNHRVQDPVPNIYASFDIGTLGDEDTDVKDNQTLEVSAKVTPIEKKATVKESRCRMSISKLKAFAISKKVGAKKYETGDYLNYTLIAGNNGGTNENDVLVVDTIPYKGDQNGSSFDGELQVHELILNNRTLPNLAEWKCYYTESDAAKGHYASEYKVTDIQNGASTVGGATVVWKPAAIDSLGVVNDIRGKTVTAIAWMGSIPSRQAFRAEITLKPTESKAKDRYVNSFSKQNIQVPASTEMANRSIAGRAWVDENKNGKQDDGEINLSGVQVVLLEEDGTGGWTPVLDNDGNKIELETKESPEDKVKSYIVMGLNSQGEGVDRTLQAIAKADGSYEFSGLQDGTYGVRFLSGSTDLSELIASPTKVGQEYIDSDAVPTYSDGGDSYIEGSNTLTQTQITDITLPALADMTAPYYRSEYHDSGLYYKTEQKQSRIICGRAWTDQNNNGKQETDESGLAGVKVVLMQKRTNGDYIPVVDAKNKTISLETIGTGSDVEQEYTLADQSVIKTVAKADGNYEIYVPGGKTYGVRFSSGSTDLKKYVASKIPDPDKLTPFYKDGEDNYSNTYTEGENELERTERYDLYIPKHITGAEYRLEHQDSGFVKTREDLIRKISGKIWLDEDRDGLQGTQESARNGIRVILCDEWGTPLKDNKNKQIEIEVGATASKTFTLDGGKKIQAEATENGEYAFSGMKNGVYKLKFEGGETPIGLYQITRQNAGTDKTIDSDGYAGTDSIDEKGCLRDARIDFEMKAAYLIPDTEVKDGIYEMAHMDLGLVELNNGVIRVTKYNANDELLNGVEFRLEQKQKDGNWKEVNKGKTGSCEDAPGQPAGDGIYVVTDLEMGEYRLTETGTVQGSSMLQDPIDITLPFTQPGDGSEGAGETEVYKRPFLNHKGTDYYVGVNYKITNDAALDMPRAGGLGIEDYRRLGILTVLFAGTLGIGGFEYSRRRRIRRLRDSLK